jgi:hypothetical protein
MAESAFYYTFRDVCTLWSKVETISKGCVIGTIKEYIPLANKDLLVAFSNNEYAWINGTGAGTYQWFTSPGHFYLIVEGLAEPYPVGKCIIASGKIVKDETGNFTIDGVYQACSEYSP